MSITILQRVARGEQSAVGECIARYGGLVATLANRLLRDIREVDDGVQDVFVELWKVAGRYDPDRGTEDAFVSTVARRRLIDRRRRNRNVPRPTALEGDLPAPTTSDPLERHDVADRLRDLWERLDDGERDVLDLAVHHGMTYAEVAETRGLPLGTVKSRARAGLRRLREGLRHEAILHGEDPP